MEKAPKSKGTIVLRYLQKAATFTITNNPHSPRGERLATIRAGLSSGPIGSIIPSAARHKKRSDDTFDEEPTSPKVTCIGQIKHKKTTTAANEKHKNKKKKKIPSGLTRMLSQRQRVSPDHKKKEKRQEPVIIAAAAPAPSLGQLKKFASGRDTLTDFDWEKAVTISDDEEKEDVMNIYHSAPLVLGGDVMAAEHKEVGLWRRRSVAALMPLEVINK